MSVGWTVAIIAGVSTATVSAIAEILGHAAHRRRLGHSRSLETPALTQITDRLPVADYSKGAM